MGLRKKSKDKVSGIDDVFAEMVPRADVNPVKKVRKRQKWFKVYIYTAIFALPIMAFLTFSAMTRTPEIPEIRTQAYGKGTAEAVMNAWVSPNELASTAVSGLPRKPLVAPTEGLTVLGWEKFESVDRSVEYEPQKFKLYTVETHSFAVLINGEGGTTSVLTAEVQIAVDPETGDSWALGWPSLVPYVTPQEEVAPDFLMWGVKTDRPTESVTEAVGRWAKVYSSGNPADLKAAVGDPNVDNHYVPLSGFSVEDVNVSFSAKQVNANGEETQYTMVRVTFILISYKSDKPGSGNDKGQPVTMDLLLDKADTATPVVVAWGGPGDAPVLRPFSNAVLTESKVVSPFTPTTTTTTTVPNQAAVTTPTAAPVTAPVIDTPPSASTPVVTTPPAAPVTAPVATEPPALSAPADGTAG